MPFTIFGPGVQDSLSTRQLFPYRSVEQTERVAPYPRIHGSEEEDGRDPSDETHPWHGPTPSGSAGQRAVEAYAEAESIPPERVYTAGEIMTAPVVTLSEKTPVEAARRLFRENRFRHVPIVDAAGQLVGILSERDTLRHAAERREGDGGGVARLMADRVVTATPGTRIREVARVMYEQRLGALPVVTEDAMVRGIITRGDILRMLIHNAPLELWA